jgi:hypothetical protein
MNEPARAPSIPAEALWVPDRGEFRLSRLVDGLPDGEVRWFRADGSLAGVSTYVAGKGEGPYERFHENGEWSQRGQMRNGHRDGLCRWRRTDGRTTENTLPAGIPDHVREATVLYQDGLPGPSRYYDGDGVEVRQNGRPLPPRPATVDDRAGYSGDDEVWFFGLGAQDPTTRHGTWRWWFPDGIEQQVHEYRRGSCIARLENHRDGSPRLRSYKDARGWDLVQRCFDEDGREVLPFGGAEIPPRPDGVPADAVFDSSGNRWVAGFDPSVLPPMGEIELYELDGPLDQTLRFADGQLRLRRLYNREGRLLSENVHDERGRETCEEAYWGGDGSFRHRVERTFAGDDLVAIDIRVGDRVLRGRLAEDGLAVECLDAGAVTARGTIAGKRATGTWEFLDGSRTHRVDLTGRKLRAELEPDFEPSRLLGVALLDDGAFPDVAAFAGLAEPDWADVPSCYGEDTANFPKYLRALVSEVPAVRLAALHRIAAETLHQGTIYVATAVALRFMLRLLDHPNADVLALLQYAESVTGQAAQYREEAQGWDDDSDDRRAVLGTLQALEDEFPRVAAQLDAASRARVAVALALAARAGQAGEALLERAARLDDSITAATAVHGLLDRQGEALTPEQASPWLAHPDPIVRVCAAIATARHLQARAPAATSAVLCAALDQVGELSPRFSELPFVKGTLLSYLALALGHVRDDAAMGRAVDLAARFNHVDLFTLDLVSFGALRLCFGDGTPPFAPGFIEVLAAIAGCGRLEGFANFSESAAHFGLPTRGSEYRALVETLRAAPDPTAHMAELLRQAKEDSEAEEDEDEEDEDEDEEEEEEEAEAEEDEDEDEEADDGDDDDVDESDDDEDEEDDDDDDEDDD